MHDSLQAIYQEFLDHMTAEKNASTATITSYITDFKIFEKFLLIQMIEPGLQTITTRDLRKYVNYLKLEKEYSNATIRRKIHSLSSFFKFVLEMEYIEKNPMLPIHAPKLEERIPVYINENDLRKLLEAPKKFARYATHINRDRTMIALLVYTGGRKSEIIHLDWNNVDFKSQVIHIRKGKGKKDREIPLIEPLAIVLLDYYNERHPAPSDPILVSDNNKRISSSDFQNLFRRYLSKCGLANKGYSPHKCRHAFATLLYQNGVDLLTIQKILGHSDLNSTKVYTHIIDDHMREEMAKFPVIVSI